MPEYFLLQYHEKNHDRATFFIVDKSGRKAIEAQTYDPVQLMIIAQSKGLIKEKISFAIPSSVLKAVRANYAGAEDIYAVKK